ncbi:MAG: DUF4139 domain-containing protein [Candidatus Eisenbacteria bacterium]|nr:DUF4139 domain-containing protein [Candidatus Eisenbacteria bacterium]
MNVTAIAWMRFRRRTGSSVLPAGPRESLDSRRVRRRWPAAAAALLWGAVLCGAGAQERSLSLTVYNSDLGAVRDERELAFNAGRDTVRFQAVPERIDPTSVLLEAVDGPGLLVLEQNYAYDLVSPSAVLNRYLDREIFVRDEDGEVFEGLLKSHSGDQLVLTPDAGGVVMVRKERIAETRCPALPQGLTTRPTLVWLVEADTGGRRRVRVSYLTGGLSWTARYVAVVNDDETEVRLGAWVNVTNESGADYPDAGLQLVAGDVHRVRERRRPQVDYRRAPVEMAAKGEPFEEEAFFEYHLYTMDRRTTLADRETKQLALFAPARVQIGKEYEYAPWKGEKVRVVMEFVNSEEKGLGRPLPAGIVRVYKADRQDRLQFVGEDRMDHTPRDEEVRVFLGEAFDLVAERTVVDRRRLSNRVREEDVEITLRNRKEAEDVEIVVEEKVWGDWRIVSSSHEYEQQDAQTIEFRVPVRAGEERVLTYTVRITT